MPRKKYKNIRDVDLVFSYNKQPLLIYHIGKIDCMDMDRTIGEFRLSFFAQIADLDFNDPFLFSLAS